MPPLRLRPMAATNVPSLLEHFWGMTLDCLGRRGSHSTSQNTVNMQKPANYGGRDLKITASQYMVELIDTGPFRVDIRMSTGSLPIFTRRPLSSSSPPMVAVQYFTRQLKGA